MVEKQCAECGKVFTYTPPLNFPDKRKYCDECSAKKKASYEASKGLKSPQVAPTLQITPNVTEARHDVVISRKEKPHSYEFGPSCNRHKLYYNDVKELKEQIDALKEFGFYEEFETKKI